MMLCEHCERRAGHPARLDCDMMRWLMSRPFIFALGILWGIALVNYVKG